jgi:hypothetical protein
MQMPSKKDLEEYEQFKNNQDAVCVQYGIQGGERILKWFKSEAEFQKVYAEYRANTPSYRGFTDYYIKRKGYNKPHPNDRKCIFRLPYFDFEKEYKHEARETFNKLYIPYGMAIRWVDHNDVDAVIDLIKKYIEYKGD